MNIEAYDADSLRKMVRLLEYENRLLKDKLKKASIPYDEINPFEEKIENAEEYDPDQGERIVNPSFITEEVRTAVIFPNVIIVGMTGFALSNVKRRYFVKSVKIPNGQGWMLKK